MKKLVISLLGLIPMLPTAAETGQAASGADQRSLLDHDIRTLNENQQINLHDTYHGKVVLIVNTASKCAFTSQYEGLEKLYADYQQRGVVVLGFPSNDFANQEPDSEEKIQAFCRLTYGVQFPMFSKTRVKKGSADPLYAGLARAAGEYPGWNFHKYLIDRDGKLAGSFSSFTKPQSRRLIRAIEGLL